jgi:hypothetical protein
MFTRFSGYIETAALFLGLSLGGSVLAAFLVRPIIAMGDARGGDVGQVLSGLAHLVGYGNLIALGVVMPVLVIRHLRAAEVREDGAHG